jgi:hypothetical protein
MDNILPHVLYTNVKTMKHNKNIFEKTCGETFFFLHKMSILKQVFLILNYQ